MVLSDGVASPEAFVPDDLANVWRTTYRVPLHPRQERLALSVTARTDSNHWRRVWVFLHVVPELREEGEPDSTMER